MTCDRVLDRLFDEELRSLLASGGAPPSDLCAHLASCAPCRAAWREALDDAALLRASLLEPPPPSLVPRLLRSVPAAAPPGPRWPVDWRLAASFAAGAGAAAAAGLSLTGLPLPSRAQLLAFASVALLTFTAQVFREGLRVAAE